MHLYLGQDKLIIISFISHYVYIRLCFIKLFLNLKLVIYLNFVESKDMCSLSFEIAW